ncbi:MAG: hypothetical protein AAF938_30320, partial [Myxococcota bacterium]
LLLAACGDDDTPPLADGSVDLAMEAGADAGTDIAVEMAADTAPADMFVVEPPPSCPALPEVAPPACGSGPVARGSLIPGPADDAFDAALAAKAFDYDRAFHAIFALHTGVNTEVRVPNAADRETIRRFFEEHEGWDLAAFAESEVADMVSWNKVAGAYGGVGAAADAFRYAVLRDEGAACEDVERARSHVRAALGGVRRAFQVTGEPGIIARGYQRNDVPGNPVEIVPLFDESGAPLPAEKNNGTWRADNSGALPEYDWEDSCSRDMIIGWVVGIAALWEVMERDPTFTDEERTGLRGDAQLLANSLMEVREEGRDLEIWDADGRRTFHGTLHESAIESVYLDFSINAQHAIMSLGIMSALARVTGDEAVSSYVHNELVRRRRIHELVRDMVGGVIDFEEATNYSNYNMAYNGAWLANRYLCGDEARTLVSDGITSDLYEGRQPEEIGQSFFDFTYLATRTGATVGASGDAASVNEALTRGLATLNGFPAPPFWNENVENCDAAEIEAGECTAIDGETLITLSDTLGRGDNPVSTTPLPMSIRPPSNFYWRSDPYRVNSPGNGQSLFPGVDFRMAYWIGRYLRVE